MSCAVAIFVKSPELSPVKTRLWPGIGRAHAERLHRASAATVCSVVTQASASGKVIGYWALAESAEASARLWPGLLHVEQGEGSLGERMAAVYRRLRQQHAAVILIGADAPPHRHGLIHATAPPTPQTNSSRPWIQLVTGLNWVACTISIQSPTLRRFARSLTH